MYKSKIYSLHPRFSAGIGNFFRNKGNKSDTKDKDKKHDSLVKDKPDSPLPQKTDTSKVYTRNSKAGSPKSLRPESSTSLAASPAATQETKMVTESPKVVAPCASEESLDEEQMVSKVKAAPSGEVKRSDSGREEEKSVSSKSSSKSSTPEEGGTEEEEEETGASATAATAATAGQGICETWLIVVIHYWYYCSSNGSIVPPML